jgi:hypothetical protein
MGIDADQDNQTMSVLAGFSSRVCIINHRAANSNQASRWCHQQKQVSQLSPCQQQCFSWHQHAQLFSIRLYTTACKEGKHTLPIEPQLFLSGCSFRWRSAELVASLPAGLETHREVARCVLELLLQRVHMVCVHMGVAHHVHKLAWLQPANL